MNSAQVTTAWILRAAAAYILRHGYHQPSYVGVDPDGYDWDQHHARAHYDTSSDGLTPAASVRGAIAIVVFGGPVTNVFGDDTTAAERRQYHDAVNEYDATAWMCAYAGNGWSPAEEAVAELLTAAQTWEQDFLRCPECGERVVGMPPAEWPLAGFCPVPAYSHRGGTPLCPVYRQGGITPAEPVVISGGA